MTAPRQVLPGTIYLVTRRCIERRFFLKPSKTASQVFLYLLAVAAERFGILVHAFCVLSNHYHLVVTDPHARLPAFHQLLDALVARALSAALGRWETFWAPDSYSAVTLLSPSDVVAKAAYVLANPVDAGLVGSGSAWPGPWSAPERIGGTALEISRPRQFFDPNGGMPENVTLRLTIPAGLRVGRGVPWRAPQRSAGARGRGPEALARAGRVPRRCSGAGAEADGTAATR